MQVHKQTRRHLHVRLPFIVCLLFLEMQEQQDFEWFSSYHSISQLFV